MALLEINHLQKSFGSLNVLKDINLQVEEGQVIAVIGPSGSGKSTMLRCATTLEQADAGDIYYDGEPLIHMVNGEAVRADKQQLKKIRSFFGLVFQDYNLFPHFTVMRNITEAPVHVAGVSKEKAEERALQLLATMGLSGKENYYPSQLSGGQQQRVAIARALATDPKVLLCDEATSALDPKTTRSILKLLRQINEERGITLVVITHEMGVIKQLCNKVAVIEGGRIVERGDVQDVFARPRTKAARKLFFPDSEDSELPETRTAVRNRLRLVFDEKTAYKPIISNMILATGEPVNLLYANMDALLDEQRGQMVIALSDNKEAAEKQKAYLIKEGVEFTEIEEDSDYYDYPLHGFREEESE